MGYSSGVPAGPAVSIVVPTLNEAGNIDPLLKRLQAALEGVDHEIIVVDDGSTDGTREEAKAADPDVRVEHRPDGGSLASAVVRGIELAKGEHVCVMDGDLQHPPETVPDLLRAAKWRQADLVVGSRYVQGGGAPGFAWHREAISWGARQLIKALLPSTRKADLTDTTSGLFLFRRDRVDPAELDPDGYKILLEVLERGDFDRIEEVGYTFQSRETGDSNLSLGTVQATLTHLLELAWEDRENRRLVQFGLVGLVGLVVNLGLLTLLTEGAGLHYLASGAIAVEASILSNFALNDAVTFRDLRQGAWTARLGRFNVVSLLALVVNLAVLSFLTEVAGVYYLASEVVAIGVAFATNYRGNVSWTYVVAGEETVYEELSLMWSLVSQRTRAAYERLRGKIEASTGPWMGREEEPP